MNNKCRCGGRIRPTKGDAKVARFWCEKCGRHYSQGKRQKKMKNVIENDIVLAFRFADHKVHAVGNEGGVFDLSIQEMQIPEDGDQMVEHWGEVILAKATIEEFAALTALAIGFGEARHEPAKKDLTTDDLYVIAEKWFVNNPNVPRFIP